MRAREPSAHTGRAPAARIRRRALLTAAAPAVLLLGACGQEPSGVCTPAEELDPTETAPGQEEHGSVSENGDPFVPSENARLSERGLALSPDGSQLAANEWWERRMLGLTETSGTTLWDTATGEITARLDNDRHDALAWHPGGSVLAIGGGSEIDLTDPDGTLRWRLTGHAEGRDGRTEILDLAFRPDGEQLASLGSDGTVRLWATGSPGCSVQQVIRVRRMEATSLSYSPDGEALAICGPGGAPELWDPRTGRRSSRLRDIEGTPHGLTHAPDGSLLIGHSEPTGVTIVQADGTSQQGAVPLSQRPWSLAVGPEHQVAVGGENDNQVMVWNLRTDEREDLPRVPGSLGRLRWAPDGDVLYGVSRLEGVVAWDGTGWTTFEQP